MPDAIVNPVKTPKDPDLAPLTLFISGIGDMRLFAEALKLEDAPFKSLMASRVYPTERFTLAGPATGAPYAAILLETLIAWGARRFIYVGWCGSIVPELVAGDVVVATAAIADEGTTPGYGGCFGEICRPSEALTLRLETLLREAEIPHRTGTIWTTDAIFRETPEKLARFGGMGALAVEMELSALFYIARFRKVEVASVLVVSDELASLTWKPGFKASAFKKRRTALAEVICTHVERFR